MSGTKQCFAFLRNLFKTFYQREFLRHLFQFSTSSFTLQATSFLQHFFLANWLGAQDYGTYNGLMLFLIYLPVVQLGVLEGLFRETPILQGQNNYDKIKIFKDSALTFTVIIGLVLLVIAIPASILFFPPGVIRFGVVIVGVLTFFSLLGTFYNYIFRAENRFSFVSRVFFVQSLAVVATIPLIIKFHLIGAFIGLLVPTVATLAYSYYIYNPFYRLNVTLSLSHLKELVKAGLPILLIGYISSLADNIDRFIILSFLSPTKLGYYAATKGILAIIGNMVILPFSSITYPRIAKKYGEHRSIKELPVVILPLVENLVLIIPVIGGMFILSLPLIIRIFLPGYLPGIAAAQILTIGVTILSIYAFVANLYYPVNKVKYLYYFYIIQITVSGGSASLLLWCGLDITGVAISRTLGVFIYTTLLMIWATHLMGLGWRFSLSFMVKSIVPVIYCCGVALILNFFLQTAPSIAWNYLFHFIINIVIYLIATGFLIMKFMRNIKTLLYNT